MDNEWIKELKVGDNVFVCGRLGKSLRKVQRITPVGRIVIDNIQYNPSGRERTSDKWTIRFLEQATEESVVRYKKAVFVSAVKEAINNINGMTYLAAKQLNEILNLGVVDTSEDKQ